VQIGASLASEGKHGLPLPAALYLAPRYGYSRGCEDPARRRAIALLERFAERLLAGQSRGGPYYFGSELTALDVYSAVALPGLGAFVAEGDVQPAFRAGFEWLANDLADHVPKALLDHRRLVFDRHLECPIQL